MTATRMTIASTNARIDALSTTLDQLLAAVQTIAGQHSTPAMVTEITSAPSKRARKAAPAKAVKATARKATVRSAAKDEVLVVTLDDAAARVAAGEDAWKITVLSSKGNPVPFGLVRRAAGVKTAPKATAPKATVKASKTTKVDASLFALSGPALKALGTPAADAEIARRAAKRAAK